MKSPVIYLDGPLGCGKTSFLKELLASIQQTNSLIRNDNIIYIDCLNFASSKSNYETILTNIFYQIYKGSKKRWY